MKVDYRDIWKGQTVVCLASGPSLNEEDCRLVKESGLRSIVTNTTYKLCPWADILFAFDAKWWKVYKEDAELNFKGRFLTCCLNGSTFGIDSLHGLEWFNHYGNSGTAAVSLAINAGAKRVILLGYDCQKTGGKSHWHGDHPEGFSNCNSMKLWNQQYKNLASFAKTKNVEIINCSRQTALEVFKRMDLKDALQKN